MVSNRIEAWLRLRDVARFRRDAKFAADDIRDLGKAGNDAQGPLNQLGQRISGLVDAFPGFSGRTRIFGFAVGTVATALIAVIPLIVGLGGALVAVAGSLGAAAVGAGLLGTALLGALLPLLPLALVGAQFAKDFGKVSTAWTNFNKAVGAFGRNSTQAETALQRLWGVVGVFGGREMLTVVKQWQALQTEFRKAGRGALLQLIEASGKLIATIRQIMPFFMAMAEAAARVVNSGLDRFLSFIASPRVAGQLSVLADNFGAFAGPLFDAVISFFSGFLSISARLAPNVGTLSSGIAGIASAFADWAANGDLSTFTAQLQSWWDLLTAVGGLMLTVFGNGASEGQSLVQSLTAVVNKWNDFLKTTEGKSSLKRFFTDAVNMTRVFFAILAGVTSAIFIFGRALVPIYTKVMSALRSAWASFMDALAPAKPFFDNVLGPLLKGLAEGVIGNVVGAFKFLLFVVKLVMIALGWLGKVIGPGLKPLFETLGKVIGFIFGGWILKLLGSLGKLSILLGPLGFGFRMLALPVTAVGRILGGLLGIFEKLWISVGTLLGRAFPMLRSGWNRILGFFMGLPPKLWDVGVSLWTNFSRGLLRAIGSGLGFALDIGKAVYNFIAGKINGALPNKLGPINLPDNPIPMLAAGGVVSGAGSWITGEAGPELNTLLNGSVTVQPLSGVSPQSANATLSPRGGKRTIVTKVFLRGKQIAEAVADEVDDDDARK